MFGVFSLLNEYLLTLITKEYATDRVHFPQHPIFSLIFSLSPREVQAFLYEIVPTYS